MRVDGTFCGLHFRRSDSCTCDHHCTGCPNVYGQLKDNCCTCCRKVVSA